MWWVVWTNDYRLHSSSPPSLVLSWRVTNRSTNMFSSGGLFNYSAFSLQITQELSGLGEQRDWCKESDDGIRWIPMALLELDLSSQFSREREACSRVTLNGFLPADETQKHHFTLSDSWERWGKMRAREEGSSDTIRWRKTNTKAGMLRIAVEGTVGEWVYSCCDLCSHHVRTDWESKFWDEENR